MKSRHLGSTIRQHTLTVAENRLRMGVRRARVNFFQIAQATVAAVFAYWFAQQVLGHQFPFLAAVAATVGVGVTTDKRVRRALEFGIGATLGVLLGEVLIHLFGVGLWQMLVIMLVSFLIGYVLNGGQLFVTQMGIQAIIVVSMPAEFSSGPFSRTSDALVGAATALLLACLIPWDPRREPRNRASALLREIAELLDELGDAIRRGDTEAASRALSRARDTQAMVDSWRSALRISQEAARINPSSRRHAAEISRLARACEYGDRAMRLVRVIARRAADATAHGLARPALGEVVAELAQGARRLNDALVRGESREAAQEQLTAAAKLLDPVELIGKDIQGDTLVLLLRPLAVDLLQASGMPLGSAEDVLPGLPPEEPPGSPGQPGEPGPPA